MFFVYRIHGPETDKDYIGVTNNLKNRWSYHANKNFPVGHAIRKYNWTFFNNMTVIFNGTEQDCYFKELDLRPHPRMGLNLAIGGVGGFGKLRKNVTNTPEHIAKMRFTMSDGRRKAEKNSRAIKWVITSPSGIDFFAYGNLQTVCDDLNINRPILVKNLNNKVPDLYIGYGGYRKYNDETHIRRLNTVGWKLRKLNLDRD